MRYLILTATSLSLEGEKFVLSPGEYELVLEAGAVAGMTRLQQLTGAGAGAWVDVEGVVLSASGSVPFTLGHGRGVRAVTTSSTARAWLVPVDRSFGG